MFDWKSKTSKEIVKYVGAQYKELQSKRSVYEPLYDLAIKLFQPRRHDLSLKRSPNQRYGVGIYDPRPDRALAKFSSGMVGNTISRNDVDPWWIQFVSSNQRHMEIDEVKQRLQEAEEQVRFGFNQSTFYREMPQFMRDAGCTYAVMTAEIDKVEDRIVFLTRNPNSYYFAVNNYGRVIADFFDIEMNVQDMVDRFGKDNLPNTIKNDIEKRPFKKWPLIHAVFRNYYRNPDSLNSLDLPYIQIYICKNAGRDGQKLLEISGLHWRPLTLRLGATGNETYPISPALDALTQATYSNALGKCKLEAAHYAVQPPRLSHANLRSQILKHNLAPKSTTYTTSPEEKVEFLMNKINWPVSDAEWQEKGQLIDEVFFVQFFEMLSGNTDVPQRTAYEVSQMVSEKITMMGSTIEGMEDDVLEPASNIIWQYEQMAGRMPEMPGVIYEGGSRIQNLYHGRLAQLRRSLRESKGSLEQLQIIEVFSKLFPKALLKIKEYEFIEEALIATGMNQDLFRSDQELGAIIDNMEQQQKAELQMEIIERMGKALPGFGKGIDANSPAALMEGAA